MSTVLHKSFKFTKTYRMNEQVNNDAINEVWRNAHIALQSISDIKDQVGHDGLKAEILKENLQDVRIIHNNNWQQEIRDLLEVA